MSMIQLYRKFSMVELLVVMSVLMVLMTLGLKSFDKTLEQSLGVRCLQHLRTLGQGIQLFSEDHGLKMPSRNIYRFDPTSYDWEGDAKGILWKFQVGNYVYGQNAISYADMAKKGNGGWEEVSARRVHEYLITKTFECPRVDRFESDLGFQYEDIPRFKKGGLGWNFLIADSRG